MENVILGAGPAGLSCGYELVKNSQKCLVIEKDHAIGGISKTLQFGEFRTDIGPHRFFSKNMMLYELIEELLGQDWIPIPRLTRQYIDGKYYDYPVKAFQAFLNAGPKKAIKMALDFGVAFVRKNVIHPPTITFEDWVVLNFGRALAEFNLINYTEKIWGISTRHISATWAEQRIKGLSLFEMLKQDIFKINNNIATLIDTFYYPRYGIGQIYDTMAQKIREYGNAIHLESYPIKITHSLSNGSGKINTVLIKTPNSAQQEVKCENLVSSIPITELVQIMDPPAPPEVISAVKRLRYRDQRYVFITLNREKCTPDTWIYFPTEDIPFGRLMEPKNWTPEMTPAGKTSLLVEYFCFEGDQIWTMSEEKLVEITRKYLVKLGFFEENEFISGVTFSMKKAYPIWDIGYEKHLGIIKRYLSQFSNLYLVGRNGRFHYNNQDHSIETGILAGRSIIENKKYDLEVVGTENEYFEKGNIALSKKKPIALPAIKSTEPKKPGFTKRHPKLSQALSFGAGISLVVAMLFYTGIDQNIQYLRNIDPLWISVAAIIFITSYLIRGVRWRSILLPYYEKDKFSPNIFQLTNYDIFGAFMNIVLPLKLGDITKAFAMGKRENTKITNLLATIVLERLFDIIALGILIVFPIYYFGIEFLFKDDFRLSILFGFALIAIVIAFLFILIFKKEFVIQIISKILSIVPFIKQREGFKFEIKNVFEQLNYALKELFDDWKQTVIVIFTSVLVWLLEGITAYYVALAFNVQLDIILIVAGVVVANFLKVVPATPAGIGFYELGLFVILNLAGIPEAAVIGVIDHLIKNIILCLFGGISTMKISWNKGEK